MRRVPPGARGPAVIAAASLAMASPAAASTASVTSEVYGKGAGEVATIAYVAAPGERNALEAQWLGGPLGFRLRDLVAIAPGSGCRHAEPNRPTAVVCRETSLGGGDMVRVRARLGDGDDTASVFAGDIDGGPGSDRLITHGLFADRSSFHGGPGNDAMVAETGYSTFNEDSRSNGADTLRAGPQSIGEVRYSRRRRDVRVTLDGRRNDGERGERDSVIGVRTLIGGRARNVLVGDADNNVLYGNKGSDLLKGGGGDDTLDSSGSSLPGRPLGRRSPRDVLLGGAGNDELEAGDGRNLLAGGPGNDRLEGNDGRDELRARDRGADLVECGQGADVALIDARDFVGRSSGCERVRRRGAAAAVPIAPEHEPAYIGREPHAVNVLIGCPADGPRSCGGSLEVMIAGRHVASHPVRIRRGRTHAFLAPLTEADRRALRAPDARVPVDVTVSSRDRRGVERRRRLAFTVRAL